MMCIRCVMEVASTFNIIYIYIYIYIYIHINKLVKLIKFVFGSRLVSSAAVHLVGSFRYSSELSAGCCAHGCNYCFYIFFMS